MTSRGHNSRGSGSDKFQPRSDLLQGGAPGGCLPLAAALDDNLFKPVLAIDPVIIQAAVVAHPAGIDRIILARLVAVDDILA